MRERYEHGEFPRCRANTTTRRTAAQRGGTCDLLAQIEDERLALMGLLVRSHRQPHLPARAASSSSRVGIPLVWFDVLIHIGGAEEGRLTMSRLSAEVALTTGGVTRLVDRMVDAGLVARQNCPSDRRSVHVVLTPAGQATLAQRHRRAHRGDRPPPRAPLWTRPIAPR